MVSPGLLPVSFRGMSGDTDLFFSFFFSFFCSFLLLLLFFFSTSFFSFFLSFLLFFLHFRAKISSAVAFPLFEANVGPIKIVEHFGTEKLKAAVIPKICSGEAVLGIAMSEPDAGQIFSLFPVE